MEQKICSTFENWRFSHSLCVNVAKGMKVTHEAARSLLLAVSSIHPDRLVLNTLTTNNVSSVAMLPTVHVLLPAIKDDAIIFLYLSHNKLKT